ncbi:uncharacterized protein LOC119628438 [Bombyx mori]|uniref:Endonuclease-reverse transcriptase n=1 Tax=Bombyx mori TaxID=7091 RepID=A0A8R2QUI7_BOMMO|nr:uncharacterized protein LOC119628438 [Bombyx mori]
MDLKYKHLVDKLNIQEKQIDYLERENKRRNLVFFGIEEEGRSYFQLYTKVAYILTMNMKLSCEKYDIENVKRIGRKGNKVRPIIVALTTLGKKIEILKNRKSLASTSYYIQEDYPKKVLEPARKIVNGHDDESTKNQVDFILSNKPKKIRKLDFLNALRGLH